MDLGDPIREIEIVPDEQPAPLRKEPKRETAPEVAPEKEPVPA